MCSNLHDNKCFKLSMSHACSLNLAWDETYTNYLFIKKKHILITSNNNLSEIKMGNHKCDVSSEPILELIRIYHVNNL